MNEAGATVPLEHLRVSVYRIPTDQPESDGTFAWDATTLVLVELEAGGKLGIGYSYADKATGVFIQEQFAPLLQQADVLAIAALHMRMSAAIRNIGRQGVGAMALAAVDTALWDLKAKLFDTSVAALLGPAREAVPLYGSGGFTSYTEEQLRDQFLDWTEQGVRMLKMKVGRDPEQDPIRVQIARDLIGADTALFVDANGAYSRKQALDMAYVFMENDVSWFEEPVSSDDLEGLALIRNQGPAGMAIAAGEYGYDLPYFLRLLNRQAVDVLQADLTRCAGVTGFLGVAALCEAHQIPLSCHCAPALHLPVACAAKPVVHMEYFHDHVRIEKLLFDSSARLEAGMLSPDRTRPGFGFEFKHQDALPYAV